MQRFSPSAYARAQTHIYFSHSIVQTVTQTLTLTLALTQHLFEFDVALPLTFHCQESVVHACQVVCVRACVCACVCACVSGWVGEWVCVDHRWVWRPLARTLTPPHTRPHLAPMSMLALFLLRCPSLFSESKSEVLSKEKSSR